MIGSGRGYEVGARRSRRMRGSAAGERIRFRKWEGGTYESCMDESGFDPKSVEGRFESGLSGISEPYYASDIKMIKKKLKLVTGMMTYMRDTSQPRHVPTRCFPAVPKVPAVPAPTKAAYSASRPDHAASQKRAERS